MSRALCSSLIALLALIAPAGAGGQSAGIELRNDAYHVYPDQEIQPALDMAARTAVGMWAGKLSITAISPGSSAGPSPAPYQRGRCRRAWRGCAQWARAYLSAGIPALTRLCQTVENMLR